MGINGAGLVPGGGGSGGGGGSTPGASIVRHFPFAFNTPNILTGATLYTPTIGDILLDAWVEIDTAWDGTTPLGDFGSFVGQVNGDLYYLGFGVADMTKADQNNQTGNMSLGAIDSQLSSISAVNNASNMIQATGAVSPFPLSAVTPPSLFNGSRFYPAKFITADPIKFCVSQDGTNTGANPGSTQGAAVLYLITATPT